MFNWGWIEGEFNSHRIGSGSDELMIYMMWYVWWYWYELMNKNERNDNKIGDSGGCSVGDGLKVNSTLTLLDLGMRS